MQKFIERLADLKERNVVLCIAAFALTTAGGWVQNGSVYATVAEYFGIAREINTFAVALGFLLLAVVVQRKPSIFDARMGLLFSCGSLIAAVFILLLAMPQQEAFFTTVGLLFSTVGKIWTFTLMALTLYSMKSLRAATASVALGFALGEVVRMIAPMPPLEISIAICCLSDFAIILFLYKPSSDLLKTISEGTSAADLEMASPQSFLNPFHTLFLCAFLFSFASGYALTLNEIENAPIPVGLIGVVVVAVALVLIFGRGEEKADALFSFSALLVIAGFLTAPFTFVGEAATANACIRIGIITFDILLWMVIVAVGRRNIFALLPTLGFARFMKALGTNLGAIVGHTSNDWIGINSEVAALIAAIAVFIFIAFLWLGFRKFSFEETIKGVIAPRPAALNQGSDDIEGRCAEIGTACGLTERETEIFAMLARGRNGQYIREYYVVSRNTVKSHIKHIYQKLEVHSQQELIDLVSLEQVR